MKVLGKVKGTADRKNKINFPMKVKSQYSNEKNKCSDWSMDVKPTNQPADMWSHWEVTLPKMFNATQYLCI